MPEDFRPRLRPVESFPVSQPDGEVQFALRDPEGFAGSVLLPYPAAVVAAMLDGERTLADVQRDYQARFGQPLALADLEHLLAQLDDRWLLDNARFRARWKVELEQYLNSTLRPAAHANTAYSGDPERLRQTLDGFFLHADGPGRLPPGRGSDAPAEPPEEALCAVLSPHVDVEQCGAALAWAHHRLAAQSAAEVFVILGTAHRPMSQLYSLSRKSFHTPLGTVEVDDALVRSLRAHLAAQPGGRELDLEANELAHRCEHSIEFQVLFLQHVFAGRPLKIVPILVGSFREMVVARRQPIAAPPVAAFVAALGQTLSEWGRRVCLIGSVDLAHLGQRYGDRELLTTERLAAQADDDAQLLADACRGDAAALFQRVAEQDDRHRIGGLSSAYTMLAALRPRRGEVLKYGQSVAPDGTSCVTFASAAFYGPAQ